jgi:adenylate kinase
MLHEKLLPTPVVDRISRTEMLVIPETPSDTNRVISVTGVSCAGKGTFIAKAQAETQRSDISWLSGGTLVARYLGNVDRDQSKYVPYGRMIDAMMQMGEEVLRHAPVVMDAHHIVKHLGQRMFVPAYEQLLRPRHYIVIASDPYFIHRMRIEDNERGLRHRDPEDPAAIADHQQMIVDTLAEVAKRQKSGLTIIYNTPYNPDEMKRNVAVVKNIIETIE